MRSARTRSRPLSLIYKLLHLDGFSSLRQLPCSDLGKSVRVTLRCVFTHLGNEATYKAKEVRCCRCASRRQKGEVVRVE